MSEPILLPRRKRSDMVVEEVKRWIVKEGWKPGDRLPQEKELMNAFGVSKGTIRESLKSLEVQGLIRINTGPAGGAVLSEVTFGTTAELLSNYFFFRRIDAEEIYRVRKLVEPEVAAAAVPHLTDDDIARLEESLLICETAAETAEERKRQRFEELAFHNILADACPNELLRFIGRFINEFLMEIVVFRRLFLAEDEHVRLENVGHHRRLLEAIYRRDVEGVRGAMSAHMHDCQRHVVDLEAVVTNNFLNRD
jgi:GntR family transcriptional repressor for pyruvate dehydrogenase complex